MHGYPIDASRQGFQIDSVYGAGYAEKRISGRMLVAHRESIVRYIGPNFYDMELTITLPSDPGGDLTSDDRAVSSARAWYKIAEPITFDQARALLSVRDYSKALTDKFLPDAHAIFVDWMTHALAALILSDEALISEIRTTMERHFDSVGGAPVKVTATKPFAAAAEHLEYLLNLYSELGWTGDAIKASVKGKPRPKFTGY